MHIRRGLVFGRPWSHEGHYLRARRSHEFNVGRASAHEEHLVVYITGDKRGISVPVRVLQEIRRGTWPRNDLRLSVPGYIAVARKRRDIFRGRGSGTEPRTPRQNCRFGPETRQGFPGLCGLK